MISIHNCSAIKIRFAMAKANSGIFCFRELLFKKKNLPKMKSHQQTHKLNVCRNFEIKYKNDIFV